MPGRRRATRGKSGWPQRTLSAAADVASQLSGQGKGKTCRLADAGAILSLPMVILAELRERVAAAYGQLDLPSWPNPHPGMTSPRDEEYSRFTQPDRYRIVHSRARVWADALVDVPGIASETLAAAPLDREGRLGLFDRGVRLASSRPGTLPLFLLEHAVGLRDSDRTLPVLQVSVVEPQVSVERVPDCGCDACDCGSADLLQTVDDAIGRLVSGPFVVMQTSGWQAQWYPDGGSSGGTRRGLDHRRAMELGRRLADGEDVGLPKGLTAFIGHSWVD